MSSFSSGTLCDITAGISCIIFLITVLQVRHMAPLTVSCGVSVGDDSSGEIMNQWPPVQTTTGANLYKYRYRYRYIDIYENEPSNFMSHWSKVPFGASTEMASQKNTIKFITISRAFLSSNLYKFIVKHIYDYTYS